MRRLALLFVVPLSLTACGDDDRPRVGVDAGGVDSGGGGVDAGDPMGNSYTYEARYLDRDDMPLMDVKVAIDTDMGRYEAVSDAAGEVAIDVRFGVDEYAAIHALERFGMFAVSGYPITEDLGGERDGNVRIIHLFPVVEDATDLVRVRASATGVPSGGRYCLSIAEWFADCFDEMGGFNQQIIRRVVDEVVPDSITGWAYDSTGALVDFDTATWVVDPSGDRTASIAFDGAFATAPVTRDVTLTLPTDRDSPYRTTMLDDSWHSWMLAVSTGTHLGRSALTNVLLELDQITMTISTFPIPGEELVWAVSARGAFGDTVRTTRWFSMEPTATTFEFLDVPRVTSGTAWNEEFEWSEPAADVDFYFLAFNNNADRRVVGYRVPTPFATLPALPTGYDTEISFPFAGANGRLIITAVRGDLAPDEDLPEPYAVDGESATGPTHDITF